MPIMGLIYVLDLMHCLLVLTTLGNMIQKVSSILQGGLQAWGVTPV